MAASSLQASGGSAAAAAGALASPHAPQTRATSVYGGGAAAVASGGMAARSAAVASPTLGFMGSPPPPAAASGGVSGSPSSSRASEAAPGSGRLHHHPLKYVGSGHWSTTLRANSLVVLSALDRALKDRVEELQVGSGGGEEGFCLEEAREVIGLACSAAAVVVPQPAASPAHPAAAHARRGGRDRPPDRQVPPAHDARGQAQRRQWQWRQCRWQWRGGASLARSQQRLVGYHRGDICGSHRLSCFGWGRHCRVRPRLVAALPPRPRRQPRRTRRRRALSHGRAAHPRGLDWRRRSLFRPQSAAAAPLPAAAAPPPCAAKRPLGLAAAPRRSWGRCCWRVCVRGWGHGAAVAAAAPLPCAPDVPAAAAASAAALPSWRPRRLSK